MAQNEFVLDPGFAHDYPAIGADIERGEQVAQHLKIQQCVRGAEKAPVAIAYRARQHDGRFA